jgi:hypothetical protein
MCATVSCSMPSLRRSRSPFGRMSAPHATVTECGKDASAGVLRSRSVARTRPRARRDRQSQRQ